MIKKLFFNKFKFLEIKDMYKIKNIADIDAVKSTKNGPAIIDIGSNIMLKKTIFSKAIIKTSKFFFYKIIKLITDIKKY